MTPTTQGEPPARELPSRLAFETLLADLSASLLAAPTARLERAVEAAVERAREFFEADRFALLHVGADRQVQVRLSSCAAGVACMPSDTNLASAFPWTTQRLLDERMPVHVASADDLPLAARADREAWARTPIQSALALPIESRGAVSHVMMLQTAEREHAWFEGLLPRLRVLGEMLVAALERSEMFDRLRASEARLASGAELAGLGFYEVDLQGGTAYVDERFRALCGVPADALPGFGPLDFWMEHLHPEDRPRVLHQRERLHAGPADHVSVEYRFLHPGHGTRWIAHLGGVASRDGDGRAVRTYGVLRDVTAVKRTEEDVLDLSRRLIQAHEDERALLARDLHDDVTQRLAVLAIDVGRAFLGVPEGPQVEAMHQVRAGLVELSEDIHALATQLHPSVLRELGLVEALRTECERWTRQGRLDLEVDLDPTASAPDKDTALCLFRVAQEALNNVSRHSGARSASVALGPVEGGLQLCVRDAGAGFDPDAAATGRRLGLASMRERVRLVNGTLDVESALGRGTAITVWIPAGQDSP